MPPSESSSPSSEIRRRVAKACQRCRLKKCKCDGQSPCIRCESDNAICAYGKRKQSEKQVYRKGYVQLLERQHSQLKAGVQELYQRLLDNRGWSGTSIASSSDGQPSTHQILKSVGVLSAGDCNADFSQPPLDARNLGTPPQSAPVLSPSGWMMFEPQSIQQNEAWSMDRSPLYRTVGTSATVYTNPVSERRKKPALRLQLPPSLYATPPAFDPLDLLQPSSEFGWMVGLDDLGNKGVPGQLFVL